MEWINEIINNGLTQHRGRKIVGIRGAKILSVVITLL